VLEWDEKELVLPLALLPAVAEGDVVWFYVEVDREATLQRRQASAQRRRQLVRDAESDGEL
ncbi:MAG: hypothetical protein HY335_05285, partial [Deinococcus sp.]|nr:hypothetical protein [Deinococcus sp.]